MSNSDSFIDEVTEEVRRDRLFGLFRRYGWIGVAAILLIVGWSAWTEWSASRQEAAAQRFGDAVAAAMAIEDVDARTAALEQIETDVPEQQALLTMLRAGEPGALAALEGLSSLEGLPPLWRDLAEFKLVTGAAEMPAEERRARLEALTAPGAPLRLLAEEQIALIEVQAGETEAAIERLNRIVAETGASAGLRQRATQLIVALGGTPG